MIACVYRWTRSRHWKTQSKTGLALRLAPTDGGRLHNACPFIASAGATAIYHALGMATYPWATAPVHVVYEYVKCTLTLFFANELLVARGAYRHTERPCAAHH